MEHQKSTKSAAETQAFAKRLAQTLPKKGKRRKKALFIALEGDLGSGKTTFAKGFAKGLGIKSAIKSPTFLIYKSYKTNRTYWPHFFHFDCYRVKSPKDILALGWKKIVANPRNIVLVEWADRVKQIIPRTAIWISLRHVSANRRTLLVDKFHQS